MRGSRGDRVETQGQGTSCLPRSCRRSQPPQLASDTSRVIRKRISVVQATWSVVQETPISTLPVVSGPLWPKIIEGKL